MGVHAIYGGSNCATWINCAEAGRAMQKAAPGKTSIYAAEGTAAHIIAEQSLLFGFDLVYDQFIGSTIHVEGFDILVDEGMMNAVKVWHDYVSQRVFVPGMDLYLEERVFLDHIWTRTHDTPPHQLFGTADAVAVGEDVLHIFDYKHGSGVPVEADTLQGLYYAAGALAKFAPDAHLKKVFNVVVHIIQPRAPHADGPVRSKIYTILDLANFQGRVRLAINNIDTGKGGYNIGKWCRWCPRLANCPEQLRQNIAIARGEFSLAKKPGQEVIAAPVGKFQVNAAAPFNAGDAVYLTREELSFVLRHKDQIRGWLDACEQEARRHLANGMPVPGFKLVDKRKLKSWVGETAEIIEALEKIGAISNADFQKLVYENVVSPAQAKKLLSKETYTELENHGLIQSASTGTTLAPDTDKRPAVSPGQAAISDFGEQLAKEQSDDDV